MKISISRRISTFLWGRVRKIFNSETFFAVTELNSNLVKCEWEISKLDKLRVKYSNSYFYAIRIYDISLSGSKSDSTCIMKEFQVGKNHNHFIFSLPSLSRKYVIEFGYRKPNGDWRELTSNQFNRSFSILTPSQPLFEEDWFDDSLNQQKSSGNIHEKSYQLSFPSLGGGSEKVDRGFSSSASGRN